MATLCFCMTNNANAATMCIEGSVGSSCSATVGTIGPLEPENCALLGDAAGNYEKRVVRQCFGTAPDRPTIAYRECEQCTWGYRKQKVTTPLTGQNCGDLYYYECVPYSMAEVRCFDSGLVENFTNENGCARGQRLWYDTTTYGALGPIEFCQTCQSGYTMETQSVDIAGCSNGPFEVDVCVSDSECSRDQNCPGWSRFGTDVSGKPGLKQRVICNDSGKCDFIYTCDGEKGYYNGSVVSEKGPTSCNRCPLYQNKYGQYGGSGIKRMSGITSITGCYISLSSEITAAEGTFEIVDEHCMY